MKLLDYLNENGVDFTVMHHDEYYTAQEEAAAQGLSGHMFAKTVVVRAGDEHVLLVLPASERVDFERLAAALGAEAQIASEKEMAALFEGCDVGAEPPFGSQYGVPTYVDTSLEGCKTIVFRAGTHDKTVKMGYGDYVRLEQPKVAGFAVMEG